MIILHLQSPIASLFPTYFARPIVELNEPSVLRTDEFGNSLTNITVIMSTREKPADRLGSHPTITVVIADRDMAEAYNSRTANISIHQEDQTANPAHGEPVATGYESESEPDETMTATLITIPPGIKALWNKLLDITETLMKGLLTFLFAFGPDWAPVANQIWCIVSRERRNRPTEPKALYTVLSEEDHPADRAWKKIQARIQELETRLEQASNLRKVAASEASEKRASQVALKRAQEKLATLEEQRKEEEIKAIAQSHRQEAELAATHEKLDQARKERAEVLDKTQDLVHDLQNQLEEHFERSQRKSDELATKEGQIAELEWDNEQLMEEKSRQTQEVARLSGQLEELQRSFQKVQEEKVALKEANQRVEQAKKEVMALNAIAIRRQDELIAEYRKVIDANRLSLPPSGVRNSLTTGIRRGPPQPAPFAPRSSLPPPNAPRGPRAERPPQPAPSAPSSMPPSPSSPSSPSSPLLPPSKASPAPPALTRPTSSEAATFPVPEGGPVEIPWFVFPSRPGTDSQK